MRRAAVFSLSAKNLTGGLKSTPPPPAGARVNIGWPLQNLSFKTIPLDGRHLNVVHYTFLQCESAYLQLSST